MNQSGLFLLYRKVCLLYNKKMFRYGSHCSGMKKCSTMDYTATVWKYVANATNRRRRISHAGFYALKLQPL